MPASSVLRVARKLGAVATKTVQLFVAELSGGGQRAVQGERGMTFREHEAVPVGVVRRGAGKGHGVQCRQQLSDREGRANVSDVGPFGLLDHRPPDQSRDPPGALRGRLIDGGLGMVRRLLHRRHSIGIPAVATVAPTAV